MLREFHPGNHQHVLVIFCRRPQQARPADIDHLDGVFKFAVRVGHGLFKRIQVDHDHIDRLDTLFGQLPHVLGFIPVGQDGRVDFRVQGLDPAVQHFRKTGYFLDHRHRDVGLFEVLGRSAGADDLDPEFLDEGPGEIGDPCLVIYRDQCSFDFFLAHGTA